MAGKLGISELTEWKPAALPEPVYERKIDLSGIQSSAEALKKAILHTYDIRKDVEMLKKGPEKFEALRGSYWIRREFSAYTVCHAPENIRENLIRLGFNVE